MKTSKPLFENADIQLQIGDPIVVVGNVQFKGEAGDIKAFDNNRSFVMVDLYDHGTHSFHISDIEYNDPDAQQDNNGVDDDSIETFYVVIVSDDEEEPFVGSIVRDGSRWRESGGTGPRPHNWGGNYMGYLSPDDIVSWLRKDYGSRNGVDGPFDSESDAQDAADMLRETQSPAAVAPAAEPVPEPRIEKIADRYEPDEFDAMVGRLKKLAGAGPLTTVWDPKTRRYRNMPVAVQPPHKQG